MNLCASFNKPSEFVTNGNYTLYIYEPYKLHIQTLVATTDFRVFGARTNIRVIRAVIL
jgi:hypothetical protein